MTRRLNGLALPVVSRRVHLVARISAKTYCRQILFVPLTVHHEVCMEGIGHSEDGSNVNTYSRRSDGDVATSAETLTEVVSGANIRRYRVCVREMSLLVGR